MTSYNCNKKNCTVYITLLKGYVSLGLHSFLRFCVCHSRIKKLLVAKSFLNLTYM